MTTAQDALAAMTTYAQGLTTDQLIAGLEALESKGTLEEAERATRAVLSDVLIEREGITEAMDALYWDNLDYEGTALDAIKQLLGR